MWISYHIFLWDYSIFDNVIVKLNKKLTTMGLSDYFFIRYWEGSPHIRLRVWTNLNNKNKLYKMLNSLVLEIFDTNKKLSQITIDKNSFYKSSFTDGKDVDPQKMPWYSNGDIEEIEYIPEIKRYGNYNLMPYSESSFILSSKFVTDILRIKPTIKHKIIFLFTVNNFILKKILNDKKTIDSFINFGYQYWNNAIPSKEDNILTIPNTLEQETLTKISKIKSFKDFVDSLVLVYEKVSKELGKRYACMVLFSHLHMFSNRLGTSVVIEREYYKSLSLKKGGL